jgi:hypothetical protein
MGGLVGVVITAVVKTGLGFLVEWFERKRLEAAERRIQELEGLLAEERERALEEREYRKITKKYRKAKAKEKNAKEKLTWIQAFNEDR